jgi:small conductance mechanosensitive channel
MIRTVLTRAARGAGAGLFALLLAAVAGLASLPAAAPPARAAGPAPAATAPAAVPAAVPAAPTTAAAPAPASVSPEELERLVNALQDEGQRAKLVQQLQGLIAAERAIKAEEDKTDPASLVESLSDRLDAISGELLAAAAVVVDAPRLIDWVRDQVTDPTARERWLEVSLKLSIIFGFALFVEWVTRTALIRARRALDARDVRSVSARLLMILARATVEALPIIAFALIAYTILPLTQPRFATAKVAATLISANLAARIIVAVANTILLPREVSLFLGMTEETRNYLFIWVRRFTHWAVYGYGFAEGAWWLGVPGGIYAILLKGTALVLAILATVFVLQNRVAVARWLRGRRTDAAAAAAVPGADAATATASPTAPFARYGGLRIVRNRLADVWHLLAITYIVGIYCVYALRITGGFTFVLRGTVLTLALLVASRVIVGLVQRASRHGFAISPELKAKFPTLEQRANRYLPILLWVTSIVVYAFAALAILQAWDIESFSWFGTNIGRRLTGSLLTIGGVLLTSLVGWEIFSSAIERYLSAVDDDGRPVARSARARTLLPLFRSAMLVLLVVMVSLIVLSELGVNIAPLLAGAGVVGLAIGFGSQALVKDVITGLFILIEDTLAVGDVVDVGGGHSGVVEALSVRTIRLRDMTGTVHTVPFSAVTTIKNMTRDFAFFVADVALSYAEDPDNAVDVLKSVADELAADAEYRPLILDRLEVIGLDTFKDNGFIIKVRLKTLPMRQWVVGREFNRRMKKAFDRAGVAMATNILPNYLSQLHPAPPPVATPEAAPAETIEEPKGGEPNSRASEPISAGRRRSKTA